MAEKIKTAEIKSGRVNGEIQHDSIAYEISEYYSTIKRDPYNMSCLFVFRQLFLTAIKCSGVGRNQGRMTGYQNINDGTRSKASRPVLPLTNSYLKGD